MADNVNQNLFGDLIRGAENIAGKVLDYRTQRDMFKLTTDKLAYFMNANVPAYGGTISPQSGGTWTNPNLQDQAGMKISPAVLLAGAGLVAVLVMKR